MTRKIAPAQLDEIEAAAKKASRGPWEVIPATLEEGRRIKTPAYELMGVDIDAPYLDITDAEHIAMMDPATTLALVARVKELEAQAAAATQQPAIDTLYGEGASSDLWRTALGLERTYAGFCATGDHYCLQSVGHYCQGGQQFIEELEEEEA